MTHGHHCTRRNLYNIEKHGTGGIQDSTREEETIIIHLIIGHKGKAHEKIICVSVYMMKMKGT